jgi:hypothetical protein
VRTRASHRLRYAAGAVDANMARHRPRCHRGAGLGEAMEAAWAPDQFLCEVTDTSISLAGLMSFANEAVGE